MSMVYSSLTACFVTRTSIGVLPGQIITDTWEVVLIAGFCDMTVVGHIDIKGVKIMAGLQDIQSSDEVDFTI